MDLLSRLVTPTGTKGCARHVALAAPFVPVGVTNRDKRGLFVPVARPGTKGHPFCPGPGQISISVVLAGYGWGAGSRTPAWPDPRRKKGGREKGTGSGANWREAERIRLGWWW